MSDIYAQMVAIFLGFFAIMNPIANTAAFTGLVGNRSKEEQVKIATKALLTTFVIILVFSLLGKAIFHMFDITLPALRISGGVLMFLAGYHMLSGNRSSMHSPNHQSSDEQDIAVSPLAVPLLAGPGTIATAMNYAASGGAVGIIMTVVIFALLCIITFFCFVFSSNILLLIGKSGLDIVTRLMGLILTVMAVQMVIAGVTEVFHLT